MTFGLALVLTILVVVKEKPIARLLLTPVKRSEILLSKYVAYIAILVVQASLLIGASVLNGLYIVGTVFDLFMALVMLGFDGIALGLLISVISKTKTEANQYFFMFFIVIVMLSGMFIPIGSMPIYLQVIAWLLPLSHSGPMFEGILTKGKSFLGFDFYWLLGIGLVLFIMSFMIFKRKQYEA
jgi:ABC-2 type transport system permease protein